MNKPRLWAEPVTEVAANSGNSNTNLPAVFGVPHCVENVALTVGVAFGINR
jgi:hypothetical protein